MHRPLPDTPPFSHTDVPLAAGTVSQGSVSLIHCDIYSRKLGGDVRTQALRCPSLEICFSHKDQLALHSVIYIYFFKLGKDNVNIDACCSLQYISCHKQICSSIDNGVGLAAQSCQVAKKFFNLCALEYACSPLDPT